MFICRTSKSKITLLDSASFVSRALQSTFRFFFFNAFLNFECFKKKRESWIQDSWWESEEGGRGGHWFCANTAPLCQSTNWLLMSCCMMRQGAAPPFLDRLPDSHQPHWAVWQGGTSAGLMLGMAQWEAEATVALSLCKACFIPQLTAWGSCVRCWITSPTEIKSVCVRFHRQNEW